MKLRNLTLIAGLLGVLFTNTVFALGMGELKLNSSLNEPLDAEIELLNVGDLGELEMLVGLASRDDFETAGVDRLFLLTDLRFKVDLSNPDKPMIRVSSRKPIREPYLDFLMELHWPSGRLLREYTLLLDLPVYATERAAAKKIKAASTSPQPQVTKKKQAQPVRTASSPVASQAQKPASQSAGMTGEYRVASGDTAWGIAKKIKPNDASIMQSLAAIKQSNPSAFINGNINLLKSGAVLRLPSATEISRLSHKEVNSEVDFNPESALADSQPSETQLDATPNSIKSPVVQADGGGRLKLATPVDDAASDGSASGTSPSGASGGASSADGEALQSKFALFQEELDKTQRENEELKTRLSNMEEQMATMSRLVEIKDDSLRATQLASQQAIETDDISADSTQLVEAADAVKGDSSDSPVESSVDSPAESSTKDSAEAESQPSTTAKKEGFDLEGWIDLLLYPLIALLIILLAVVLFFRNRKSDEGESEELSLKTLVEDQGDEDSSEEQANLFDDEEKQVLDEITSELDERELKDLESLELSEGEDVDPIGEADIYLSLGNYSQAEGVLLPAIVETPDDPSLRLKLLEVYVSAKDLEKFDDQHQDLMALNDSNAEAKAASLRAELIPEVVSEEAEDSSLGDVVLDFSGLESEAELDEPVLDNIPDVAEDSVDVEDTIDAEKPVEDDASEFELDLDLESMDLDSLALDIDADMESIELDDKAPSVDLDEPSKEPAAKFIPEGSLDDDFDDFDSDLDVLDGEDECSTKLELAQAYLDMGDPESARDILDEVVSQGDDSQQDQARKLLESVT
jgi:pilus assembly protein FimV